VLGGVRLESHIIMLFYHRDRLCNHINGNPWVSKLSRTIVNYDCQYMMTIYVNIICKYIMTIQVAVIIALPLHVLRDDRQSMFDKMFRFISTAHD
jgi:hypothetical protein